jgi:hypothetical protein
MTFAAMKVPRWAILCLLIASSTARAELSESDATADAEGVELASSEISADLGDQSAGALNINYFTIFYGPSVKNPGSFQPTRDGQADVEHPVLLKNFFNVGYDLTDHVAVTGTGYWIWRPVRGQSFEMRDPQLRISHNELVNFSTYNLYGDIRAHFGVSDLARSNDEIFSLQAFQIQTCQIGASRLTAALYTSERPYFYGKRGFGPDFELYVAPALIFQVTPKLSSQLLFENNWSHTFGDRTVGLNFDGNDLEPGVSWDLTNWLNISPYLHLYPKTLSLASTSFGATLSVRFL